MFNSKLYSLILLLNNFIFLPKKPLKQYKKKYANLSHSLTMSGIAVVLCISSFTLELARDALACQVTSINMLIAKLRMVTMWFQISLKFE